MLLFLFCFSIMLWFCGLVGLLFYFWGLEGCLGVGVLGVCFQFWFVSYVKCFVYMTRWISVNIRH